MTDAHQMMMMIVFILNLLAPWYPLLEIIQALSKVKYVRDQIAECEAITDTTP